MIERLMSSDIINFAMINSIKESQNTQNHFGKALIEKIALRRLEKEYYENKKIEIADVKKIRDDLLGAVEEIDTDSLLILIDSATEYFSPEFLINDIFLKKELKIYNSGKILPADAKYAFMVGDYDGNFDMRFARSAITGKHVRKKPARHYKAPEMLEVLGKISDFLEHDDKSNKKLSEVYSEIADVFYNGYQMKKLDPFMSKEIDYFLESFCNTLNLSKKQVMLLVSAKYHQRLYSQNGKNDFSLEDKNIEKLLETGELKQLSEDELSEFCGALSCFCNVVIKERLLELKKQDRKSKINSILTGKNISSRLESKNKTRLRRKSRI